jgi:nucleoside-diphosphate-sugar epimerase
MKIAVTGATSEIGIYLVKRFEELGHEVLTFTRNPRSENDIYFDIEKPEVISHECDVLVHLGWRYWDIGDSTELNLVASTKLLSSFKANSGLIFLSTLSAYTTESRYGNEKQLVEKIFLARQGLVIRAGVLWGGASTSGMANTIDKIKRIPFFCLHLNPDPILFLTHYEDVFEEIIQYLNNPRTKFAVSGNRQPILLSEILHSSNQQKRIHLSLSIKQVLRLARFLHAIKVRVPFRFDSLRGVLNDYSHEISNEINSKSNSTHTVENFKNWINYELNLKDEK